MPTTNLLAFTGCFLFSFCNQPIVKSLTALIRLQKNINITNFLKDFIYLFMRDREREREKQREKQAPCREPHMGLDPGSPGSCPGLKAALNR